MAELFKIHKVIIPFNPEIVKGFPRIFIIFGVSKHFGNFGKMFSPIISNHISSPGAKDIMAVQTSTNFEKKSFFTARSVIGKCYSKNKLR